LKYFFGNMERVLIAAVERHSNGSRRERLALLKMPTDIFERDYIAAVLQVFHMALEIAWLYGQLQRVVAQPGDPAIPQHQADVLLRGPKSDLWL